MKVLVTGASGFLGTRVVMDLLRRGHEVIALVSREPPGGHFPDHPDLRLIQGTIYNPEAWLSMSGMSRPDSCVHLAWHTDPSTYLTSPLNVTCLTASLSLLNALLSIQCNRFLMAGTCAEYDSGYGLVTELSAVRPETLYAASKLALGLVGSQVAAGAGATFIWARLFSLYGPGEHPDRLIPSLIRALLDGTPFAASDGLQVRDYLHVDDVAGAIGLLLERSEGGPVNICSGEPIQVRMLIETLEEIAGAHGFVHFGARPVRSWEPPSIVGDCARLLACGWRPTHTLKGGLQGTYQWWKAHHR